MGALAKMFRLGPKIRNVTTYSPIPALTVIEVRADQGDRILSVGVDLPGYCAEVLIANDPDNPLSEGFGEVRLNYDECGELIRILRRARRDWRRAQDAIEDAELLDEQADRAW